MSPARRHPVLAPSGVLAPAPAVWADSLAAQVRRILAEELAALPVSSATKLASRAVLGPAARGHPRGACASDARPERAGYAWAPAEPRFVAPESATIPPVVAVPESAMIPPNAPPLRRRAYRSRPRALARSSLPSRAPFGEAFASDGLFTTQLLLFETGESETPADLLGYLARRGRRPAGVPGGTRAR